VPTYSTQQPALIFFGFEIGQSMRITMKNFAFLLLLLVISCHGSVFAQPELDTSYGTTGSIVVGTSFTFIPLDMVIQPDKKTIVISSCRNTGTQSFQFCLVRLNENGSLDTTFDEGSPVSEPGTVLMAIPGSNTNSYGAGRGLILLENGKILAIGSAAFAEQEQPVMIRYNSNGTPDSSFGTNGILILPVNARFSKGLLQPDGKIIIVGDDGAFPNNHQFVARFSSDGTVDNTFGENGFKTINIEGKGTRGTSITLQADGKIIAGGAAWDLTNSNVNSYFISRFNSNGSLDASFDDDGYKIISLTASGTNYITSVALQPDGRIVALGYRNHLYQLNANGSFDNNFDADGARFALNGTAESTDLTVSAGGRITVVGFPSVIAGNYPIRYRLARYLSNGSPDTNFSGDGFLDITQTTISDNGADRVKFDSQGRLVIAGRGAQPVDYPWQFAVYTSARLSAPPVRNVGFTGRVTDINGKPVINAYLALKLGSQTIGYARTNPFGYYRFANIQTNQTYTLSTYSKRLNFYDRAVLVDNEVTNFQIIGN
jgi:uncharacterized delta-60 repeat protein